MLKYFVFLVGLSLFFGACKSGDGKPTAKEVKAAEEQVAAERKAEAEAEAAKTEAAAKAAEAAKLAEAKPSGTDLDMSEPMGKRLVLAPKDFEQRLKQGKDYHLIDVRTLREHQEGTLAGSTNMDFYAKDFAEQLGRLAKDKPLFLICQTGGRSAKAADLAEAMGFKQVYDLRGGYKAWSASGLATVKP